MVVQLLNIDFPKRPFDLDHPPFENFDAFDSDDNSLITFDEWSEMCQTKLNLVEQRGTKFHKVVAKIFKENPEAFKKFIKENFLTHDQDGNGVVGETEFPGPIHNEL